MWLGKVLSHSQYKKEKETRQWLHIHLGSRGRRAEVSGLRPSPPYKASLRPGGRTTQCGHASKQDVNGEGVVREESRNWRDALAVEITLCSTSSTHAGRIQCPLLATMGTVLTHAQLKTKIKSVTEKKSWCSGIYLQSQH